MVVGQFAATAASNHGFKLQWSEATNLEVTATVVGYQISILYVLVVKRQSL